MISKDTLLSIDLFGDFNLKDWPISMTDLPPGSALVGGFVRDLLLNKLSQKPDLDFVIPTNAIKFSESLSRKINALAGIGNPNKFFDTLRSLGMDPIEHSFPDHYDFMEEDLNFEENLPIVMTEKDAIRSEDLNHLDFWYLRIKVSPPENLLDRILDKIKDK